MKLLDEALKYYDLGLNIFPLAGKSKSASTTANMMDEYFDESLKITKKGWGAYKKIRPPREKIIEWFEKEYTKSGIEITGIGLICGESSGITVVDYDVYKPKVAYFPIDSPVKVKTASGGWHLYFKYNPNIPQKGYVDGISIEIKNNDSGYVLLPPSKAINNKNVSGNYVWVGEFDREILPQLNEQEVRTAIGSVKTAITNYDDLINIKEGGRHLSLRSICLGLWNSKEKALWGYMEKLIYEINQGYTPPLPDYELKTLIRDTQAFVKNNPKEARAELEEEINPIQIDKPQDWFEKRKILKELENNAPSTGYVGLDLIIKGFVPGTVYTLTGMTNVGKTGVCASFAVNLEKQGKKVLYLALEPDVRILDSLASARTTKPYAELTENEIYTPSENIHLVSRDQVDSLEKLVRLLEKKERYDLIIIDHISYFVKAEKANLTQEESNLIKRIVKLAMDKLCSIIMIAHFNKQGAKKNSYDHTNISGSIAFSTDAHTVMIIGRDVANSETGFVKYHDTGAIVLTKNKAGPSPVRWNIRFTPLGARFEDNDLAQYLELIDNDKK